MTEKVVAITGAYKGLGAAISELLAKKGYKLVLGGKNKKELDTFAQKLNKLTNVIGVILNVRKKSDCKNFIQTAFEKFGHLDILINNAGFLGKKCSIEDLSEDELKNSFETNLYGPVFLSQEAVKLMKRQESGYILNIGSTSAIDYSSSNLAYGSSKSALIGFTGIRNELKETGIRVSVFNPGGMKTVLFRNQPGRKTDNYMDPKYAAQKIVDILESDSDEWNIVLKK